VHPQLEPFAREAFALVPSGAELLDAHTHLGNDEDGSSLHVEGLLRQLDEAGVARCCVFPLHDPERHPAYRVPNDRVLEWAAASEGRLVPFCRLDPAEGAIAEAERCLARGARGIKLHPRAQAFVFGKDETDAILALGEEAGVPVLVHAGRGMAPIADALSRAALRHPDLVLILAHGGIADQGVFTSILAEHPGVLYDSSVFSPLDLLELLARVPVERVVFGSDPPYGRPILALYTATRAAAASGLGEDEMRALLGGTAAMALEGRRPASANGVARPRTITMWGSLARIYAYCSMAMGAIRVGARAAAREQVDLAIAVCRDPDPGQAAGALERARPALEAASAGLGSENGPAPLRLVYAVMVLAATEPVEPRD
jgi:uncharacterized protein